MPSSELAEQVLNESKALRGDVATLGGKLDALEDTGRRTRWLAYGLTVVVAGVLGVWSFGRISDRVDLVQNYQVQSCLTGNETRAADKAFWGEILMAIAPPNGSPGEKAFAAKIQVKVDKRYAPRDCEAVKNGQQGFITPH